MKSLFSTGASVSALALMLVGCGATEVDLDTGEDETSALAVQEQSLGACADTEELEEVAEHACVHAQFGPFQSVSAAPLGTQPFVDVNVPHTAYRVSLPGRPGHYGGSVLFAPEETTEYAFLLSRYRGLRLYDGNKPVALECRYQVPANVCAELRSTLVADLEAGKDYRIEFRAVRKSNAQFTLLVEEAAHGHEHGEE